MDGDELRERKTGSVKAAISSYKEHFIEGGSTTKKFQTQRPYTKTRELHQAKRNTTQFNESRKLAESITAEAESKLSAAKKMVKDLTLRIEETNARAKAQMGDLGKLKMSKRREEDLNSGNHECTQVWRELELIKRELSKLKLDMASMLEEKRKAEKETESSLLKSRSYTSSIESLAKKVEEVNEENVLVEVARIEAIKEHGEIEAERREKAEKYSAAIEGVRRKKHDLIQQTEDEQALEKKLAITISDIHMLEGELKQAKEMENGQDINKRVIPQIDYKLHEEDNSGSTSFLESVMNELEDKKKELITVKEESFQFMASMDVVRNELKHVMEETNRFKKKEERADMAIENLNPKLLKAKGKLEASSAAEDKAKSIASNLSLTLEQLKEEVKTANEERSLISEETAIIKAEIHRTETEINLAEERLHAAIQDLKAVKSSEAMTMEKLKAIIESTIRNRASASQNSSTITISQFEYEYLTGHAAGAKEIADKKVAAAQAWIEALNASEKEILIRTEISRRESRELRVEEEREVYKTEQSTSVNKIEENDFEKWRQKMEPELPLPSKAMNRSVKMTLARRARARKSASPVIRGGTPRSTSFTVRGRRKAIPNLAQFFSGRDNERNK